LLSTATAQRKKINQYFVNFIERLGLVCGHLLCDSPKEHTFFNKKSYSARLDAVYATPSCAMLIKDINTVHNGISDHLGIELVLNCDVVAATGPTRLAWDLRSVSTKQLSSFKIRRDTLLNKIGELSTEEAIEAVYEAISRAAVEAGIKKVDPNRPRPIFDSKPIK
jgi:hypothetical protein